MGSVTAVTGVAIGPDGQPRCPWSLGSEDLLAYHDDEWGRPVRDDTAMFERLSLEAFQSGLSWLTILRKRENFRAAFSGFDIQAVAAYGPAQVATLLADPGIVRNRAKIEATIANARAALDLPTGLAELVWSYAEDQQAAPATLADIPPSTPGSKALSAQLRRHGFRFTGPVTAYAMMQACGIVDDHLADCYRRGAHSGVPRFKPTVAQLGIDLAAQDWQRSGAADGSLEVAFVRAADSRPGDPGAARAAGELWVLLRVAGDRAGRVLVYDRTEWECFLDGASRGEFDDAE
jgi:DNA-3-methyladenine glycosylase I